MRVLLVPPTHHYKTPEPLSLSDFPSGFAYLAASLKGHEVIGFSPNNIKGYPSPKIMLQTELSKKIQETQPDLIGFGGICTDYGFLKDAISITRSVSKAPIVLGGQIVSNDAQFIFSDLKPDYAVIGEADEVITALTELPEPGILKANVIKDLNTLPFPDYEPFGVRDMLDNYSMDTRLLYRYSRPYPRPFNIVASRSCPFQCTFCIHGHRDIPYRSRSIENIMEEIRVMYERYEFNILIILDELFAVKKERMTDFCTAVLEGKEKYKWDFDWMFQTHASARLDSEALALAKQAGCFFFSYGLESASPKVLQSMKKRIHVEDVVKAMDMAREAKVGFGANLIFGDPAETEETWAESLAFWLTHCQRNFVFLSTLMPYPGSTLFDGRFKDKQKYYEHIDETVVNMTTIPDKTFQGLLNLTTYLEKSWLFVKETRTRVECESDKMYKLYVTCPYCEKESLYRQEIMDISKTYMFGTGCTHCHSRIKVQLNGMV